MGFAVWVTGCSSDPAAEHPAQPSIDDSTAQQLREKALSDAAMATGVTDPPTVDVIRETSPFDQVQTVTSCLHDAGYDAFVTAEGGISVDPHAGSEGLPDGWSSQYSLAMYVCMAQYPLDEVYLAPMTQEQKDALADYFLDELPECLTEQGISFATPPSRDVFMADLDAQGPWSPYSSARITQAQWDEINAVCPQSAPPERLWDIDE